MKEKDFSIRAAESGACAAFPVRKFVFMYMGSMTMITAILFDLDETLHDRTKSLEGFLLAQWRARSDLQIISCAQFIDEFMKRDDNGKVWKDRVYGEILDVFKIQNLKADELLEEYLTDFQNHVCVFPDVLDALEKLQAQGVKIGIITNGRTDLQSAVIAACGFETLMDVILISETEGVKKPDPVIFERALALLNVRAEDAVFIGDSPEADIRGAHDAGMKTIWYENSYFDAPDSGVVFAVLKDYSDLSHILSTLET